jgi:ADP-ribose pyrophosphatase
LKNRIKELLPPDHIYSQWKLNVVNRKFKVNGDNKIIERLAIESNIKVALILPITLDGKVILCKQYRYIIKDWIWELPGGCSEGNEPTLDVAKREMKEEIGYDSDNIVKIGDAIWFDPSLQHISFDAFVATNCCEIDKQKTDSDELFSKIKGFSPKELCNMVKNGKIVDSKTLAVLYLGRKYIEKYCD